MTIHTRHGWVRLDWVTPAANGSRTGRSSLYRGTVQRTTLRIGDGAIVVETFDRRRAAR